MTAMQSAVQRLTGLVDAENRFDIPPADLLPVQMAAAHERFQDCLTSMKLLRQRAEPSGLDAIRDPADLVQLLFAHTTYKSYPESWMIEGRWDRLAKWLGTVSRVPVTGVDADGVRDIDDWLGRLDAAQYFVSCSSGTTGRCSMILSTAADRAFSKRNATLAFAWGTGITPARDYRVMGTVPIPVSPRNVDSQAAITEPFGDGEAFYFPGAKITIGQVSRMVALRRSIADGTATPSELADFETMSAERQAAIDAGMTRTVEALIESRHRKLIVSGQFALMYQVAGKVRDAGYGRDDFRPENAIFAGGGLKGAQLPPDYRETIMATFNVPLERMFQYYGMQEINTTMPRCWAGRYHVPPWLILLVLDRGGDALVPPSDGETEGRAGLFDLSIDGRWGGIISGDRISVRYGRCDCGHQGPTIANTVVRYADLGDGDKITCAGTIDAYIRGAA
jgi:hypothetical protein